MELPFNKRAYRLLLITALISLLMIALFVVELIITGGGMDFMSLVPLFYLLYEAFIHFRYARDMRKGMKCKITARIYGIIEFVLIPIFLVYIFISIFIISLATMYEWYAILSIVSLGVYLLYRLLVLFQINFYMKKGYSGFISLKNQSIITICFFISVLAFYIASRINIFDWLLFLFVIADAEETGANPFDSIPPSLVVGALIQIALGFFLLLQTLYRGFSNIVSSKMDEAMDLRSNFKVTNEALRKYHLMFWLGILIGVFLATTALVSAFTLRDLFGAYISLAALYLSIILIRLPTFFWNNKIEKNSRYSAYTKFTKQHSILIYAAICLLVYCVVITIFGASNNAKVDAKQGAFATFFIFVPWAIFKIISSIFSYRRAQKYGDPNMVLNVYIDILLAIFTLSNTLYLIANVIGVQSLKIIAAVLTITLVLYTYYISIKILVLGIRGARKKRIKYYQNHQKYQEELHETN